MDNLYKDRWNELHKKFSENANNIMKYDEWLEAFKEIIENVDTEIIDLGCGATGNNTLYLIERNKKVVSCDYAEEALNVIKEHIPNSKTCLFDMTNKFPFEDNYTELVIADLSLHYFKKEVTSNTINEIKRILKPNGYLIFRVNSIKTAEFKKIEEQGTEEIEERLFFSNGMEKRFFTEEDIREFFEDWNITFINEENMNRWSEDKIVWRCAVQKNK